MYYMYTLNDCFMQLYAYIYIYVCVCVVNWIIYIIYLTRKLICNETE